MEVTNNKRMPLFNTAKGIDRYVVASIVQENWGLSLEKLLKTSQSETYLAREISGEDHGLPDDNETGNRRCHLPRSYVVRVTPDATGAVAARVKLETAFLAFLSGEKNEGGGDESTEPVDTRRALSGVCGPVRSLKQSLFVREAGLVLVVSPYAPGSAVDFGSYEWLNDWDLIYSWGAWMGQLHNKSRQFALTCPELAHQVQNWDEIHEGLMKGVLLDREDEAVAAQGLGERFGLLHGDLNVSNFFYRRKVEGKIDRPQLEQQQGDSGGQGVENVGENSVDLFVFDWDQIQKGWWEWDIAQACLTAFMLAEAGGVGTGIPVPQAKPEKFVETFVRGYHSTAKVPADTSRLRRMVDLRKTFYGRFAARALREERDTMPPEMVPFLEFIDKTINRPNL